MRERVMIGVCLLVTVLGAACSKGPSREDGERARFRDRMKRAAGARSECQRRAEVAEVAGREPPRTAPDAPPVAATGEKVTFGDQPPAKGVQCTGTSDATGIVNFLAAGRRVQSTSRRHTEWAYEVLEVAGGVVTGLQVTYPSVVESQTQDGVTRSAPSPIQGKTYRLTHTAAGIMVTDGRGRPVPAAEQDLVRARHRDLGQPELIQGALPRTPVAVGDRMDGLATALGKLLLLADPRSDPEVKVSVDGVSARLKARTGAGNAAVAVIAVTVGLLYEGPKLALRMELAGELRLQVATGWFLSLALAGPMHLGGFEDAGRMTDRSTMTCRAPPTRP